MDHKLGCGEPDKAQTFAVSDGVWQGVREKMDLLTFYRGVKTNFQNLMCLAGNKKGIGFVIPWKVFSICLNCVQKNRSFTKPLLL